MKAREIYAQATGKPANLFEGEANVVRVAKFDAPARVWFGFDTDRHAVAYFENTHDRELFFAVSQTIMVRTTVVDDEFSGDRVSTIKVSCLDRKLIDVFYAFMDDVVERLSENNDAIQAVTVAAGAWRSLLQIASSPISENRAAGLYSELNFLEQLTHQIGPAALDMWQRSEKDVHDFIADAARVEVKCSSFQDRSAVTIHGLRQLEPPSNSTLTLAVAEIQKHNGETIDDLIYRLILQGIDRALLCEKLASSDYVIGMPSSDAHKFTVLSWRYWEIGAASNVLNKSAIDPNVSDAVSSLSYALNLSALSDPSSGFDFGRMSTSAEVEQ